MKSRGENGGAGEFEDAVNQHFVGPFFKNLPHFNGSDYVHQRDHKRLGSQLARVKSLMSDGKWRTLSDISAGTGDPQASVSAQLRHLRKPRFGSHEVDKRHLGNGLYEYRLALNEGK